MKKIAFVAMFAAVAMVAEIAVSCNLSKTRVDEDFCQHGIVLEAEEPVESVETIESEESLGGGKEQIKQITSLKSFDKAIKNKKKLVMVDFWASWCGPCKMIATNIDVIAEEMSDKMVVVKVDMDQPFVKEEQIAQRYRIDAIPCMIVFERGLEVGRNVGYMTKDELRTWLKKYVK